MKISKEAKEMTTFLGPDGMYRFQRLNFGVTSAPEAFQQKMEEILGGIKRVVVYIDDILVFAESKESLKAATQEVLGALRENNLTLNADKCEYEKETIEFLGHELSKEGFNIAKKKVDALEKFRRPKNILELKSFLGLASFLSAFIRGFADISKPLWAATAAKQFEWTKSMDRSFRELKEAIASCTAKQGFFSAKDETYLYTDASEEAVGAVLVQKSGDQAYRTIAFASRLLTPTDKDQALPESQGPEEAEEEIEEQAAEIVEPPPLRRSARLRRDNTMLRDHVWELRKADEAEAWDAQKE